MKKIFSLILLTLFITSCDEKKVIYVADHFTDCEGVVSKKCMKIKENREDEWQLFYDTIEGFDYKEGFTYKIEVTISKIKNPPADGSNLKYKLSRVIYQEPSKEKTVINPHLKGTWEIQTLAGFEALKKSPTLSFENGQVSGNAGCNSYGASYTINNNEISFGLPVATKMMCGNMKIERTFFNSLSKATSFKIIKNKVFFFSKGGKELFSCNRVMEN